MSAGRSWPPRSAGPGGQSGFAQSQMAWNPTKFLAPEVAVDSTGQVISGQSGKTLAPHELAFVAVTALAFYLLGAKHMGGRIVPFLGMRK